MNFNASMEKNLVVNNREINYSGIFRAEELFGAINKALEERGYNKREKKSEELVTSLGRMHHLELRPFKEFTNYITLMIKIKITLDNVTETVAEIGGRKQKFEKGDVHIAFDSWLMTDYQGRWGLKPWVYFLKSVINKYLYSLKLEAGSAGLLVNDTAFIYAQVKKLLNSYVDGKKEKLISEEEVRRKMAEEMGKESMREA